MSRSPLFDNLARAIRIARYCQEQNISTNEGIERIASLEALMAVRRTNRREFLTDMGKLSAIGATIGVGSGLLHRTLAAPVPANVKVGIVGAGLAGLACGYELKKNGINATVFEASNRSGGRCYSLGGDFAGNVNFPGQVVERGGEFIDNLHKTMLGYVREFNLKTEDLSKQPGEVFYYFNGQRYSESAVVDEFRNFVAAMRTDLRSLSAQPTADNYTDADKKLDLLSLRDYLDSRNAGNLLKGVIKAAYIAEYGLEIDQQSSLSFLFFIHADKRSKFTPFGVFSDERYHVIGGNQQIVEGLRNRLQGQINYNKQLVGVRFDSAGKVELTFNDASSAKYDAVVFAIPFSTLRQVDLKGLQLPAEKLFAINNLRYGTNAKMMVGFNSRPWVALGSDGSSYSDLSNHQNTWETNPQNATNNRAVLTDYSGGNRGKNINPNQVQQETGSFLNDLNRVFPGTLKAATRNGNNFLVHLEHWPSNPLFQGSYTCNHPGYFTTIAGNEGKPFKNIYFAGEHANSFYEWQGFMEGAALSGIDAAKRILKTRV